MIDSQALMQQALAAAREGVAADQSPFGCAIADESGLLITAHNTVVASIDATAHAEINAIRAACRAAGRVHLVGCVVATTCEPCPMCMAALHWARVDRVYYGASIADAEQAGFNELQVSAAELLRLGGSSVQLHGGVLVDACRELMDQWSRRPDRTPY